jgi:hypothetical protein
VNFSTSISNRAATRPPLSALRWLASIAAVAGIALIALICLPHDPYERFALAATESPHYLRLRWIYERIHLDTTPIDVAFIGTSHTQSAIDSRIVEGELRQRGSNLHVVNFAIPHLGRDLHYLLVRELLEARPVKELMIEVQDFEPRAPHPAFQRLATVEDLFASPLVVNTGFFENLVRLPRREFDLFAPRLTGHRPVEFEPHAYEGPHWDDTERLHGFTMTRDATHPAAFLDARADELRADLEAKRALSRRFTLPNGCSLLQRYNRFYLEKLLALAREKNVHVTFLYLPFFHGPAESPEARYYRAYGDTLTPHETLDDATSWLNVDHLNVLGARRTSRWIGASLPTARSNATSAALVDAPCY